MEQLVKCPKDNYAAANHVNETAKYSVRTQKYDYSSKT